MTANSTNIVTEQQHSDSTLDANGDEQTLRPLKNKQLLSLSLNNNNNSNNRSLDSMTTRPKLYTIHSSDTCRFPTLEKLENTMLLSKSSKITIEPVTFPGECNNTNSIITNSKKGGSQSDAKSIHSTKSNTTKKKKHVKKKHQSTPTEIFANNLSEAVLDVDDSLEDGYVYNNTNGYNCLYPALLSSPYEISVNHKMNDEGNHYFSDHHHQKYRRPGLRSTVSELPARGVKSFYLDSMSYKFEKKSFQSANNRKYHYRFSSSGEEDEENAQLLYYSSSSGSKRKFYSNTGSKKKGTKKRKSIWCQWLTCAGLSLCLIICVISVFLASPLQLVEVISINNVLGTQKQLIFDLHVRARNSNSWSIQMSHSAFSVFAASHYVPTLTVMNNTRDILNQTGVTKSTSTRLVSHLSVEYLGTVNHLDDPLIFKPASIFYLYSKSSNSTSQIQIKNPGETKGDTTGNERWSLLIRYPYELTLRGVLKYQIFPSFFQSKVFSARVCKIVQVDPATGIIKEVPLPEQSVCDKS